MIIFRMLSYRCPFSYVLNFLILQPSTCMYEQNVQYYTDKLICWNMNSMIPVFVCANVSANVPMLIILLRGGGGGGGVMWGIPNYQS